MHRHALPILLALAIPAAFAQAPTPPMPAPAAPAMQPGTQAATTGQTKPSGSVFSPTRAAAVAAAATGTTQSPGVMPPGVQQAQPLPLMGSFPQPGAVAGTPAQPSPTLGVSKPADPDEVEVPATFVGRINGMNVYRGTGTYMFNKDKRPKAVPRDSGPTTGADLPVPASTTQSK